MLDAGEASIDGIDAAMRADGFPMGPFELMDLVGIDINLAAARGVYAGSVAAGDRLADRFRPSPIQERLVADGRLGRKTDAGFYRYEDGRAVGPTRDLGIRTGDGTALVTTPRSRVASRSPSSTRPTAPPVTRVATEADIDLAMRLGANHPSGPFERARALGGPRAVLEAAPRDRSIGPRFEPAPSLLTAP